MKIFTRDDLGRETLPGRIIQKAIGKDSFSTSSRITMGFAHYSEESGPMEPHHHAEEVVYVVGAEDAWVEFGPAPEQLDALTPLEGGMILHIPTLEWHVFRYEKGGYVDIIFIYGQTENIRPEETESQTK